MKRTIKFTGLLAAFAMLAFVVACGDDDGGGSIIDDGGDGSFAVADGTYIAQIDGTDTTVTVANKLNSFKVEGPDFGTIERSGHFVGFMFLEAGNYIFMDVASQNATNLYGGTKTTFNDDEDATDANGDDFIGGYEVVSGLSTSTSAFNIAADGFYHVVFDTQEDEALIVEVERWGAIGGAVFESACVSNGFGSDVDMDEVSASVAVGGEWTGTGIILKQGDFKVRYNDNWKIDRRTDETPEDPYNPATGYVALTNFGGTLDALEEGGANISITAADEGTYDVTLTINTVGVPDVNLARTGDAPECAFEPANFSWGVIGSATQGIVGEVDACLEGGTATDGWSTEKDLIYVGQDGGVHTWRGVFPLEATGELKMRTDCTWANKMTPGDDSVPVTITDDTDFTDNVADLPGDAKWIVTTSGFYYFEVKTADQGENWTLSIAPATWTIIGAGSEAESWASGEEAGIDMEASIVAEPNSATAFVITTFPAATGGWKIFVNDSFDFNLGISGAVDGTQDLLFNDSAFDDLTGTRDVTLSTVDGGVTYQATIESPLVRK